MDVLFLDSNVLVSASWGPNTRMQRFWTLENVELVTSLYALKETERRLRQAEQIQRYRRFVVKLRIVRVWEHVRIPDWVSIREKDIAIIQGAIAAGATHLNYWRRARFRSLLRADNLWSRNYQARRLLGALLTRRIKQI